MHTRAYLEKEIKKITGNIRRAAKKIQDGSDPEAVHDFRVFIRKLRSILQNSRKILGKYHTKYFIKALAEISREASSLRDEEVIIEKISYIRENFLSGEFSPVNESIPESLNTWIAERQDKEVILRESVREKLGGPAFLSPLKELEAMFIIPWKKEMNISVDFFALSVIGDMARTISGKLENFPAMSRNTEWLHDLRKDFKKIRYLIETYKIVLPRFYLETEKISKSMQKHLGELNDIAIIKKMIYEDIHLPPETMDNLSDFLRREEDGIFEKIKEKNLVPHWMEYHAGKIS